MSNIKVDTAEIGVLAAAIEVIKENIDETQPTCDLGMNCGAAMNALQEIAKMMRESKKELKALMESTVSFLDKTKIKFDDADKATATQWLIDIKAISSK